MQKIIKFLSKVLVIILIFPVILYAAPSPTKIYDLSITKGIMHYQSFQFDQAIESLKNALEAKPESAEANYYLGAVYNQIGKYVEAEPLLKKAVQINPQLNDEVHYEYGLSLFFIGKYPEAIKEFAAAETVKEEKGLVYYYKGLAYFKTENFDQSVPLFTRAAIIDSSLALNCSYYAGISYYKRGLFEEAKEEFDAVIKQSPESDTGKSSREYLAEMEKLSKEAQTKRWAFNLGATVQDDDNVTLEAKESITGALPTNKTDSRSIMFLQTEWNFLQLSNFKSSISYVFYQSMHTSMSQFNLQDQTGSLTGAYNMGKQQVQLTYAYEYISLEKDKYGTVNSVSPIWIIQETPEFFTQILYRYQQKEYLNTTRVINNETRGGTNNQVGASQVYSFFKNNGNARAGYNFDMEKAKEKSWDYTGNKLFGGVLFPLRKGLRVDLGAEYYAKSFKETHSLFNIKRKDDTASYSVTFLVDEGSRDELSLQYLYTENKSNIDSYSYIRNLYSFTWTKRF